MRFRWIAATAAAAVVATGCGGGDEGTDIEQRYYLSLGDSLTVGVQPDENGVPGETADGYTDMLYRGLYDADSTLVHERLGCGGEDTTTFVEGGVPRCDQRYEGRSQLEAAEEFLAEHQGRVELVTVTIGGNNFTGCVSGLENPDGPAIDTACVDDGLERIGTEVPEIADRLRTAAGPDTPIIAMTYYNPFLAALLLEDAGEDDAEESPSPEEAGAGEGAGADGDGTAAAPDDGLVGYATGVLERMNASLRDSYADAGVEVADVEGAFASADFNVPADSTTGMPTNVQRICDLTWMCDVDRGPDIHTNRAGAQEIATAFEELVG
ncbi:GDSL-type esterase/lipase family protein [Nocardiopsis sp. CNR-923]|uniref:SGNH/GDSL hydrolase family protein n=1 Tax=Nocardiopsis sp. CNR-923 TaxID=1904965 RepID=UPI000A8521F7|nr:GDSL-type esterase/lipase family protein [Nocardiopsis sp. CNR-923]